MSEIPTAEIAEVEHPARIAGRVVSRVWNVTALCFVVAMALVFASLYTGNVKIAISFSDGSGLMPGDKVRYRGIDIGTVTAIVLDDDLDGVIVEAELTSESAPLAREGTRFWIERPDIRLGQIRGLETIVGGRYLGMLPGPTNSPSARFFEGLSEPPASVENLSDGLEIVLESIDRYGLQRGSPVSYRGVEIGHVISVGLTNDSSNVVARTYIRPEYRSLIRENSKFWSNSGIDLKFGLQGFEIDAETLATIAAGGVALATPDLPAKRVTAGHRFEVAKSPRDEWLRWQPRLAIGSASLPDDFVFPQPTLAISRDAGNLSLLGLNRRRGWLLAIDNDTLLGPANLLTKQEGENRSLEIWGQSIPLGDDNVTIDGKVARRSLPAEEMKADKRWPQAKIRFNADLPKQYREVIVTCGSDNLTIPVATDQLTTTESGWQVDSRIPLDESWNGACVVGPQDGMLLGMVVFTDEGTFIQNVKPTKPPSR